MYRVSTHLFVDVMGANDGGRTLLSHITSLSALISASALYSSLTFTCSEQAEKKPRFQWHHSEREEDMFCNVGRVDIVSISRSLLTPLRISAWFQVTQELLRLAKRFHNEMTYSTYSLSEERKK